MDRVLVYPSAIPLDTDILNTEVNVMVALGMLMNGLYGTNTVAIGLPCAPTVPASMQVTIGQGAVVSTQTVDASSFGSLSSNNAPLVKCGVNLTSTTFTLTAPITSGQSINYLIEGSFQETDNTPVVLPYYNASNPTQPYSGPNNSGTPQNTKRAQTVSLQLKAGASANTGTQTTPSVDSGWIGLYVITVNFGQVTVTNTAISTYPSAPFLAQFLQSHHGGVPGQAPKINLTSEVQNALPLANLPTSGVAMVTNRQGFLSSGTFTVPAGVTKLQIEVWGAGGGGGGTNSASPASASGGAGGGYAIGLFSVTPGTNYSVTVGVGGTGGTTAPTNGSPGGTSSFGSLISATGGAGGKLSTGGVAATGGAGGTGSGGYFTQAGDASPEGFIGTAQDFGGAGGASWGSPKGNATGFNNTASPGVFPGQGGDGAGQSTGSFSGGAGANGRVIVTW